MAVEVSNRNLRIFFLRTIDGLTLQAIANQFGITRERVRQVVAAFDPMASRRLAERLRTERELEREREELAAAVERAMSRPPCPVCGDPVSRRFRKSVTCSHECAKNWDKLRLGVSEEHYHQHRLTVARSILRREAAGKPTRTTAVAWAHRMLSDDPPPPNRRYHRRDSRVTALLSEREIERVATGKTAPARGQTRLQEQWPAERIVAAIQEWVAEHGCPPSYTQWERATETHPTASFIRSVFGHWADAIRAAGFEPPRGRARKHAA